MGMLSVLMIFLNVLMWDPWLQTSLTIIFSARLKPVKGRTSSSLSLIPNSTHIWLLIKKYKRKREMEVDKKWLPDYPGLNGLSITNFGKLQQQERILQQQSSPCYFSRDTVYSLLWTWR